MIRIKEATLITLILLPIIIQSMSCEASLSPNLSYGGVLPLQNQKPAILNGQRYIITGSGYSGNNIYGFNQTIQIYSASETWQPTNIIATTSNKSYGDFYVYTAPTSPLKDLLIICGSMAGNYQHNAFIGAFNTTSVTLQNFIQIEQNNTSYITQVQFIDSLNKFILTCSNGNWSNKLITATPENLFKPSNWAILGTLNFTTTAEHSFSYFTKTGLGYALQWQEYAIDNLAQINMTTGENKIIWSNLASPVNIVRQYISSDDNYLYFSTSDINNKWHFWKYDGTVFIDMYQTTIVGNNQGNQHHANIMTTQFPNAVLISNINDASTNSYYALLNTATQTIVETFKGNIQAHFSDNTATIDGNNIIIGAEAIGSGAQTYIYILTYDPNAPTPPTQPTTTPTYNPTTTPPLTPPPTPTTTNNTTQTNTPPTTPPPTPILNQPTIKLSCKTYNLPTGYRAEINGNLTLSQTGIPNVPIMFSYSIDQGKTWTGLTTTTTDNSGDFFAVWYPTISGIYYLKAKWTGNTTYADTTTQTSFAIVPLLQQEAFSVISNSTISELSFNSQTNELTFTVNGTTGTTGKVEIYIAKSLIQNISQLNVYSDGNKMNYSVDQLNELWHVTFTYHHSSHKITISFPTTQPTVESTPTESDKPTTQPSATSSPIDNQETPLPWIYGAATVTIIATVFIAILLIVKRKKTNQNK